MGTKQTAGEKGRIFKNSYLELLTKTNPSLHIFTYGSITLGLLIYAFSTAGFRWIYLGTFAGGILFWSFFEYIMHRYIFHIGSEHPAIQRGRYMLHGIHHEFPRDEERVFMPPLPGILIISTLFLLSYLLMGAYAWFFIPGLVLGYMFYSLIHYAIHHINPPKRFKNLWLHHNLHHYRHPDKAFGVSSMFWDRIFRTMPPPPANPNK